MFRASVAGRWLLAGGLLAAGGCASSTYWRDRTRDAGDVFTLTVGAGSGIKAQVGPVQVSVVDTCDLAGLRCGEFFADGNDLVQNGERSALVFPVGQTRSRRWPYSFGYAEFGHDLASVASRRDKRVLAVSPVPLVTLSPLAPHYSQVEVVAGLGLTLRLGFNPGELLDFMLGWCGLDLYGDDR